MTGILQERGANSSPMDCLNCEHGVKRAVVKVKHNTHRARDCRGSLYARRGSSSCGLDADRFIDSRTAVSFGRCYELAVLMIIWNMYVGPTFALLQRLVSDEMRATTLAAVMLVCNLIGMGIGPQTVGMLSDLLRPVAGADSLRYAFLIV